MRQWLLIITVVSVLSGNISEASEIKNHQLTAIKEYTFCTKAQFDTRVGFVADNWAIEFSFMNKDFDIQKGYIQPSNVIFYQGPKMYHYIGKSTRPRRPDVPKNSLYSQKRIKKMVIHFSPYKHGYIYTLDTFEITGGNYTVSIPFPFIVMVHCHNNMSLFKQ